MYFYRILGLCFLVVLSSSLDISCAVTIETRRSFSPPRVSGFGANGGVAVGAGQIQSSIPRVATEPGRVSGLVLNAMSAPVELRTGESDNFFSQIFGFNEKDYEYNRMQLLSRLSFVKTKSPLYLKNVQFKTIEASGQEKVVQAGTFVFPRVDELEAIAYALRDRSLSGLVARPGNVSITSIFGDCMNFHGDPDYVGGVFQAASQFNTLEFYSSEVIPEYGISGYVNDRTQGPACAIACAAGTAVRNYVVPSFKEIRVGQVAQDQLNGLMDIEAFLCKKYNLTQPWWTVKSGYIESTNNDLKALNQELLNPNFVNELKKLLRIGIQWNTEVTHHDRYNLSVNWALPLEQRPLVTQTYNSALSIAYSFADPSLWEPFAKLILDASYEATLWTAVINNFKRVERGLLPQAVVLTAVGGGVFGNKPIWIGAAIGKAIKKIRAFGADLKVCVNHYAQEDQNLMKAIFDELDSPDFAIENVPPMPYVNKMHEEYFNVFYEDMVGQPLGVSSVRTSFPVRVQEVPVQKNSE